MNISIFSGRTTADVELKFYNNGDGKFVNFSLAVDSGFGDKKKTDFFNFTAFGKTAEAIAHYCHKGSKILVTAECHNNEFTDKNGNKQRSTQFTVQNFEFCESKNSSNASSQVNQPNTAPATQSNDDFMKITGSEDGFPFN